MFMYVLPATVTILAITTLTSALMRKHRTTTIRYVNYASCFILWNTLRVACPYTISFHIFLLSSGEWEVKGNLLRVFCGCAGPRAVTKYGSDIGGTAVPGIGLHPLSNWERINRTRSSVSPINSTIAGLNCATTGTPDLSRSHGQPCCGSSQSSSCGFPVH